MTTTSHEEKTKRVPAPIDFIYLLNAMENAAVQDYPSDHNYSVKRKAVFAYVHRLQTEKEMAVNNEQNCWKRRDEAGQRMIDAVARAEGAERELAALKRGEFICTKCGLRKDSENEPAEF